MKADEKACPTCAETIKLQALICKHCRHTFSQAEVSASVAETDRQARTTAFRNIDAELEKYSIIDSETLDEVASDIRQPITIVRERAEILGLCDSNNENVSASSKVSRNSWPDELAKNIVAELQSSDLSLGMCSEIAQRYDVNTRDVYGLSRPMKRIRAARDEDDETRPVPPSPHIPKTDTQYGVLQGPANLIGGCASIWGWAILLLTLVILFMFVTGQLS